MPLSKKGPLTSEELLALEAPDEIMNEWALAWILQGEPFMQFAVASFDFVCDRCGECCTNLSNIQIFPEEVSRLANHIGVSDADFRNKYTRRLERVNESEIAGPGSLSLNVPCPFFIKASCSIYSLRPRACVLFPCFSSLQEVLAWSGNDVLVQTDPTCKAFMRVFNSVKVHEDEAYMKADRFLNNFAHRL